MHAHMSKCVHIRFYIYLESCAQVFPKKSQKINLHLDQSRALKGAAALGAHSFMVITPRILLSCRDPYIRLWRYDVGYTTRCTI
jgi:hypothetical protein